jgi:hypothetical protein
MTDFARPVDAVDAALPGTIAEIAERTGYRVERVNALLWRLRAEGTPVYAIMGEREEIGFAPTVFTKSPPEGEAIIPPTESAD